MGYTKINLYFFVRKNSALVYHDRVISEEIRNTRYNVYYMGNLTMYLKKAEDSQKVEPSHNNCEMSKIILKKVDVIILN